MNGAFNYLKQKLIISVNDTIVVGVSGGPDSMALLHVLKRVFPDNLIVCAHVHHNLRKESDEEALMVEKYCNLNDIKFEMYKIPGYKNNKFSEEEARSFRYRFFETLLEKYESKYLFTAHHGDDLIETVLMRITRGSTLKGYSGINLVSSIKNYKIIRPLLFETKDSILKYCDINNIEYATDKTNESNDYTRNRYRNKVLPFLKKENKNIHKQFLKYSNELLKYEGYVSQQVEVIYDKVCKDGVIDLSLLNKEHPLIVERVLRKRLLELYESDIGLIKDSHLFELQNLIKNTYGSKSLNFPNKIIVKKVYNKLYFDIYKEYNEYCITITDSTYLPNGKVIKKVEKLDDTTNFMTAFDSNELSFPLMVRNKMPGDKIEVLGSKGSKKVNAIFIDEKVPREKRSCFPVVVDASGRIIWLPGLKKSKYDKSKNGKYDIIFKYL